MSQFSRFLYHELLWSSQNSMQISAINDFFRTDFLVDMRFFGMIKITSDRFPYITWLSILIQLVSQRLFQVEWSLASRHNPDHLPGKSTGDFCAECGTFKFYNWMIWLFLNLKLCIMSLPSSCCFNSYDEWFSQSVEYEPNFQSRLPFARKSNQNYFDNSYIGNVNSSQNQSWHQNSNQNNNWQQQNSSSFQIPKSACMIRFQPTTLQATCRALCLAMIVVDLCSGRLPIKTSIAIPIVHRIKPIITTIIDRLAMLHLKLIGIWKSGGFSTKKAQEWHVSICESPSCFL